MKRIFAVALLVAFFGFLIPGGGQAAEPIKFGFLHSFSGGTGQVYGIPDQEATKLAVEEINKAGGVLGRPLEMIARDDKLNPENAVREAKDLILNQKVQWIQGTVSSAVALAVSAYCKEAKVPFIVTNAQSAAITDEKGHRYLFRISTNTTNYTRSVANAAAKTWGGKKIFIIGPDYEYGQRSKKDFMDAYTKLVPDAKIIGGARGPNWGTRIGRRTFPRLWPPALISSTAPRGVGTSFPLPRPPGPSVTSTG